MARAGRELRDAVRAIAFLEAAKGLVVLLAGFGLLSLIHHDVQAVAEGIVRHMHLNPAHHYPSIFIQAASRVTDARIMTLAVLAATYSVLRFAEGYGLWRERAWAEWLAAVSGAIYVPFEIEKVGRGEGWIAIVALAVNLFVVGVMIRALIRRKMPDHGPTTGQ